jgi:hypothetical protein
MTRVSYKPTPSQVGRAASRLDDDHADVLEAINTEPVPLRDSRAGLHRTFAAFQELYSEIAELDETVPIPTAFLTACCSQLADLEIYLRVLSDWDDLSSVLGQTFCEQMSVLLKSSRLRPHQLCLFSLVRALGELPDRRYVHWLCDIGVHEQIVGQFNADLDLFTPAASALMPMLTDNLPQHVAVVMRDFFLNALDWSFRSNFRRNPQGLTDQFVTVKFIWQYLNGTLEAVPSDLKSVMDVIEELLLKFELEMDTLGQTLKCWSYLLESFPGMKAMFVSENLLQFLCGLLDRDLSDWEPPSPKCPIDGHPVTQSLACLVSLFEPNNPGLEYFLGIFPVGRLFELSLSEEARFESLGFAVVQKIVSNCMPGAAPFLIVDGFWEFLMAGWERSFEVKLAIANVVLDLLSALDLEFAVSIVNQEIFGAVLNVLPSVDHCHGRMLLKKLHLCLTQMWEAGAGGAVGETLLGWGLPDVMGEFIESSNEELSAVASSVLALLGIDEIGRME